MAPAKPVTKKDLLNEVQRLHQLLTEIEMDRRMLLDRVRSQTLTIDIQASLLRRLESTANK